LLAKAFETLSENPSCGRTLNLLPLRTWAKQFVGKSWCEPCGFNAKAAGGTHMLAKGVVGLGICSPPLRDRAQEMLAKHGASLADEGKGS